MKSSATLIMFATLICIVYTWPAPDLTGYTSRTVYNGFQQAPMQTYIVEYSSPYYAAGVPAPIPYSNNQGYRSTENLVRQKRQLMGGMGAGLAGSQAQSQSQSLGAGMGMGGMGGFPYMMGFPFMG